MSSLDPRYTGRSGSLAWVVANSLVCCFQSLYESMSRVLPDAGSPITTNCSKLRMDRRYARGSPLSKRCQAAWSRSVLTDGVGVGGGGAPVAPRAGAGGRRESITTTIRRTIRIATSTIRISSLCAARAAPIAPMVDPSSFCMWP